MTRPARPRGQPMTEMSRISIAERDLVVRKQLQALADGRQALGKKLYDEGNLQGALQQCQSALLARKEIVSHCLNQEACFKENMRVLLETDNMREALGEEGKGRALKNELENSELMLASSLTKVGWILYKQGDLHGAIANYRAAVSVQGKLGPSLTLASMHSVISMILDKQGHTQTALVERQAAEAIQTQVIRDLSGQELVQCATPLNASSGKRKPDQRDCKWNGALDASEHAAKAMASNKDHELDGSMERHRLYDCSQGKRYHDNDCNEPREDDHASPQFDQNEESDYYKHEEPELLPNEYAKALRMGEFDFWGNVTQPPSEESHSDKLLRDSSDMAKVVLKPRWTKEEDKILKEKRALGLSFYDVADCLPGRTMPACEKRYRAHHSNGRKSNTKAMQPRQDSNAVVDENHFPNTGTPPDTSHLASQMKLADSSQGKRKRKASTDIWPENEAADTLLGLASWGSPSNNDPARDGSSSAESEPDEMHGEQLIHALSDSLNMPKEVRHWTNEEDKFLSEKKALRFSFEKIAECLPGRTKSACLSRYYAYHHPKQRRITCKCHAA